MTGTKQNWLINTDTSIDARVCFSSSPELIFRILCYLKNALTSLLSAKKSNTLEHEVTWTGISL
jgi:hypothetical protein